MIFDKEQQQDRLKEAQLISESGVQVSDIVRTQGAIEAGKAAAATPEEREQAKAGWEQNHPGTIANTQYSAGDIYHLSGSGAVRG